MKILLQIGKQQNSTVSIIIPIYDESKNIINLLDSIHKTLSDVMKTQIIIVDNNSPDGTGTIVDNYKNTIKRFTNNTIKIHRQTKKGLDYLTSLLLAITLAAFGNFILNKKLTFQRKLWS